MGVSSIVSTIRNWFFEPERRTPSPEDPTFSLQDPDAWDAFFGGADTDAGVKVNHKKALKYSAVWQAVSLISGDVARLPLNVYQYVGDEGDRKIDSMHAAYRLVRRRANRESSAFRFWRNVMVHALIWNNAYVFIDRDGRDNPLELLHLLPDRTAPERKNRKRFYVTEVAGKLEPIDAKNVLHFHGISTDCMEGLDLVKHAREDIALALAARGFASKFFKHGVRTGGILELPAGMSKPSRDKIEEGFKKHHEGPDNWFKTVILREGAKFHSTSIAPGEGQMTETREQQVREVARFYNLSPSRLGIREGGGYNSLYADNQSYLDNTLAPWLEEIASECWMKLLSEEEQTSESRYFEHNTNKLLTMSPLERHQIYSIGLRNRMYRPNECRRFENLNGLGPQGDELLPVAGAGTGPAKPAGGADKGGDPTAKGDVVDPEQQEEKTSKYPLAVRRVLFAIARQARHKAKNPRAFLEMIDGGMPQFRAEFSANGDDALFNTVLAGLQACAARATADQLAGQVDSFVSQFET
jgi:HK97 family phage portal protein